MALKTESVVSLTSSGKLKGFIRYYNCVKTPPEKPLIGNTKPHILVSSLPNDFLDLFTITYFDKPHNHGAHWHLHFVKRHNEIVESIIIDNAPVSSGPSEQEINALRDYLPKMKETGCLHVFLDVIVDHIPSFELALKHFMEHPIKVKS